MNRKSIFPGLHMTPIPEDALSLVIRAVVQGCVEMHECPVTTDEEGHNNYPIPYRLVKLGYLTARKVHAFGANNDQETVFEPTAAAYRAAHYWAEEWGHAYRVITAWREHPVRIHAEDGDNDWSRKDGEPGRPGRERV